MSAMGIEASKPTYVFERPSHCEGYLVVFRQEGAGQPEPIGASSRVVFGSDVIQLVDVRKKLRRTHWSRLDV